MELTSRVLVYEQTDLKDGSNGGFTYQPIGKFNKKLNSKFFILAAENFISAKDNKISCYDFGERLTMEWNLESNITCIKLLKGPPRGESLLIGTKSGKVYRVMLDNPFPTVLIEHDVQIVGCDISLMKKYLGVVDSNKGFTL